MWHLLYPKQRFIEVATTGNPIHSSWRLGQLLLLAASAAIATLAGRAVSPLQETMRVALSFSDHQMALLQGPALALPVVIAAVPMGFLIDRYSRVRLLCIFILLALVGSLLTALTSSFLLLFIARCQVGLAMTVVIITGFSLLADIYAPAQRGRAKAVLVLGQYAGTSLAFALGGVLLAALDWRWVMVWLTAPALVLAVLALLAMHEPPRTGVASKNPSTGESLIELWRYRTMVMPILAGIVLAEIPVFAILTWAAPTLTRDFSLSPERAGAIMGTAMLVSGVLGPVLGGALADFCQRTGGPRKTLLALSALAFVCAPTGLFAFMPQTASASVLLILCITMVAATVAMGVTLFTIVVPNELRGLCLSIVAAAVALFGIALAPLIVSALSVALGGAAMIGRSLGIVCIAASLLCAAAFLLGTRSFARLNRGAFPQ